MIACASDGTASGHTNPSRPPYIEENSIHLTANPFLCPIEGTGFTWTAAAKTVSKTNAFADIDDSEPDKYAIRVTGGTGITPGLYWIESKNDNDSVVLKESIGASDASDVEVAYNFNINNVTGGGALLREAGFALEWDT